MIVTIAIAALTWFAIHLVKLTSVIVDERGVRQRVPFHSWRLADIVEIEWRAVTGLERKENRLVLRSGGAAIAIYPFAFKNAGELVKFVEEHARPAGSR